MNHCACSRCEGRASVPQKPSKKAKAEAKRTGAPAQPRIEPCKECKGTGLVKQPSVRNDSGGAYSDQETSVRDRSKKQKCADDTAAGSRDGGGAAAAAVDQPYDGSCSAPTKTSWRPKCCGGCVSVPTIAVIGAGIGGCGLALALQQRGIPVVVYERDDSFEQRRQGYGLTMQQGATALQQLGVQVNGLLSTSHYSFTPEGEMLGCYGRSIYSSCQPTSANGTEVHAATVAAAAAAAAKTAPVPVPVPVVAETTAGGHGEGKGSGSSGRVGKQRRNQPKRHNMHVPRQHLRRVLFEQLHPGTVKWGCRLASYSEHLKPADVGPGESAAVEPAVELHFEGNPKPELAAVVVGADGIFSVIQTQKIGDSLTYLNVIVILGIVPSSHALTKERVFQTLDGTTRLFVMPFSESAVPGGPNVSMWQLSFPIGEEGARSLGKDSAALKSEALKRCGEWHQPIPDLIRATPESLISGYPAYDRAPLDPLRCRGSNPQSRVTMLGDAAHPMSPFKGQGANCALVDAVTLARGLADSDLLHDISCPRRTATGVRLPWGVLPSNSIQETLSTFETAMLARSFPKVQGSREAASYLHSPIALTRDNCTRAAAAKAKAASKPSNRSLDEAEAKRAFSQIKGLGLAENK